MKRLPVILAIVAVVVLLLAAGAITATGGSSLSVEAAATHSLGPPGQR
jgi:flagellar basal body-associated protein FliL